MALYRNREVVEAYQFSTDETDVKPQWLKDAIARGVVYYQGGDTPYLTVGTPKGHLRAHVGDWIFKHVDSNHLYMLNDEWFTVTYEPAKNALDEINTTLQETVTALNSTEYVLTNDDDGHWYVVNAKDVDAFHDQLSYEDPDFDGLGVDEVGGAPNLVKFKLYRIE